jgi:hypothetical protein
VQIGTIYPLNIVQKVKRLMYTYRHINATELEYIPPTNLCHERQLQGLERKAKVEGSQLRLYKAKEGSRKHEALHA